MNIFENYHYSKLSSEQEKILKRAEQEVNKDNPNPILLLAFDSKKS